MERKIGENITFRTLESGWDVYFDMALAMLDTVRRNNEMSRPTVMIVPVGPTGQYPILAKLVNHLGVSLKNVHFFNMDEYLLSPTECIDKDNPLSFHRRMEDEFYSRVAPELAMPRENRHFPEPGREREYDEMIKSLGGVDLCLGGLGINGHIAFNEAAEEDDVITTEEFAELGTRVLPITRETRTINANGYLRGDIMAMPRWCITVGMKQILSSHAVYIALTAPWQHGIVRRVLTEKIKPQIPATLLKNHPNVTFCTDKSIAEGLFE